MKRIYTKEQNARRNASDAAKRRKANWRSEHRNLILAHKREVRYGITWKDYEDMWAAQKGQCKICLSELKRDKSTHLDHDHTTGIVRGLLCKPCNTGIGFLRDNEFRLARAIAYLRKHDGTKTEDWKETRFLDLE